jgi:competence protein ComEC
MTIVYLILSWLLGIWLGPQAVGGDPTAAVFPTTLAQLTAVFGLGSGLLLHRRWPQAALLLACVGMAALGSWRYDAAVPTIDANHIATYNDSGSIILTGLVVDEPDIRDRFINLRVAVETITLPDGTTQPVNGLILVRTFRFPVIEYGTVLVLNGRLETPPTHEEFSYQEYLARQNIHSLMVLPTVTVMAEGQGSRFYGAMFSFKQRAFDTIIQLIPEPQAGLLAGVLLGFNRAMPPELIDNFRTTGMAHIIAISGFNVAVLIAVLLGLAGPVLDKQTAVLVAIGGVVFYALLVGARPSVVRAAIMGGLYLLTRTWLGRSTLSYASLCLAAFLMTLLQPLALWDVGFQMSFMATFGLMLYVGPAVLRLRDYLAERWPEGTGWRKTAVLALSEAVIVTLAAQLMTLPLIIYYFGQVSLVSVLANTLIMPLHPLTLISGGAATLLAQIIPALGQLVGWVAWLFLTYTIGVVNLLAALPGAALPVQLPAAGVPALYGLIGVGTWYGRLPTQQRAQLHVQLGHNAALNLSAVGLTLTMLLTLAWGGSRPDGYLHVYFLDVERGTATLIQTPSGRHILIDGGGSATRLNAHLGRRLPFGQRRLDLLVATHPGGDYVTSLPPVFDRYRVDQLLTNGTEPRQSALYDPLLAAAEAAGTPIHPAQAGETIIIEDGVRLEILHPGPERHPDSHAENSVALRLVYEEFSLLLPGTIGEWGQGQIVARGHSPAAQVVRAGIIPGTEPFLAAVQPLIVVAGPPRPLADGVEGSWGGTAVLSTDQLGTIHVISDGRQMWWEAGPARR